MECKEKMGGVYGVLYFLLFMFFCCVAGRGYLPVETVFVSGNPPWFIII